MPHDHAHSCGFSAMQGTGHADLDQLYQEMNPLAFEFELVRVEQPGDYKKESWAMNTEEKDEAVPKLREDGNALYKAGDFEGAAQKYFEALSYLEDLSVREQPQSERWKNIEERKVPLLLNYSQCMLLKKDYAEVIRHTTTVLATDQDNVKALYRRAKAHAAIWNKKEAVTDFAHVVELDPSLAKSAEKELRLLDERMKEAHAAEKARLQGKLF